MYHGEEDGDDPLENAGSVQPAIHQYLKQTLRDQYLDKKMKVQHAAFHFTFKTNKTKSTFFQRQESKTK